MGPALIAQKKKLCWFWLQNTEPYKPRAFFPIKASPKVKAFFALAVVSSVGNGRNTLFWTDKWLAG